MNPRIVTDQPAGHIFRVGKVVAVHPKGHSVDVVLLDDGTRLSDVQVGSGSAGTRSGRVDLPRPTQNGDKWDITMTNDQDMLAVVGMTKYFHFVLTFIYPQVNQLAMPDDNEELADLMIDRHVSDFVTTTEQDARHAQAHPNGAHITIGGLEPPDLTRKDYDAKWEIQNNTEEDENNIITIKAKYIFLLGHVINLPYIAKPSSVGRDRPIHDDVIGMVWDIEWGMFRPG